MRLLTSSLTLSLLLGLASTTLASAAAPQASAAACVPSCPLSDKNGSGLAATRADGQAGTITCFYPTSATGSDPEEFSCTYSSTTGQLTADHDEDFCPSAASTGCASRRKRHFAGTGTVGANGDRAQVQNVVRKHSAAAHKRYSESKLSAGRTEAAIGIHGNASGNSSSGTTASDSDAHSVPDYVKSRALLSRRFRAKY